MTEREKSDRREKKIAKESGGIRVSGSGSTAENKGDVKYSGVLRQDKRSGKGSIPIKLSELIKIEFQAMNRGKVPVFSVGFDGQDQEWIAFPNWWLKDQQWWKELRDGE